MMAELQRKKTETYFSWLPRDVTLMIDGMIRPIEQRTMRGIKSIGFARSFLSAGQNLVQIKYDPFASKPRSEYRFVPELALVRETELNHTIDLQGPGDTEEMSSDGFHIHLGSQVYRIYFMPDGPIVALFDPMSALSSPLFTSVQLCRGANGWIYFTNLNKIYRFHISNPTTVEPLVCPIELKRIDWIKSSLVFNLLVLKEDYLYRWNLDTNEIIPVPFTCLPFMVDPMTCDVYRVIQTGQEIKLISENREVILKSESLHPVDCAFRGFITLSGHVILQPNCRDQFFYLYG